MLESNKLVKVVSVAIASMSLLGVSASITQAASFNGPKLGVSEVMPSNPAIKKVSMGSTYTAKDVKKVSGKKIVKINSSQWLNTKDVVKD